MTAPGTTPGPEGSARATAALRALETVHAGLTAFAGWWPSDTTTDGRYRPRAAAAGQPIGSNTGWTTSFWSGQLWLAWQLTGDPRFRDAGLHQVADFAQRLEAAVDVDMHDLGFLYSLGCVLPWRLTGTEPGRAAGLAAADHLMARVLPSAGIVQAWGDASDPTQRGRTIIDSLMNMPLLYWASEQTGDPRYAQAAHRHTGQLRDHIVRSDGTTFHTFHWDPVTGEPLHGTTQQGLADDSCWARGQAWGIYGFALAYRHTGDQTFLAASARCADAFVDRLPEDHVPYWDLAFGTGSDQPRDSSAGAIAVGGLLELAASSGPGAAPEARRRAADALLDALVQDCAAPPGVAGGPLLAHGVYDMRSGTGVDEGNLWGDYFYLEALTRQALPEWVSPW
ncbi:glycoside hydrolase family 88 protein [Cellulomonas sp. SG140]|uniref:glycoside hydrolase family 88 protein n=1 Tax=Cellulomonas sp. SG140 TaxID=2976536 RepID=UPI0021E7E996|nr:glycoside hydrolase family 88 protein [Cellulomonas sp. SG140]